MNTQIMLKFCLYRHQPHWMRLKLRKTQKIKTNDIKFTANTNKTKDQFVFCSDFNFFCLYVGNRKYSMLSDCCVYNLVSHQNSTIKDILFRKIPCILINLIWERKIEMCIWKQTYQMIIIGSMVLDHIHKYFAQMNSKRGKWF